MYILILALIVILFFFTARFRIWWLPIVVFALIVWGVTHQHYEMVRLKQEINTYTTITPIQDTSKTKINTNPPSQFTIPDHTIIIINDGVDTIHIYKHIHGCIILS